MALGRDLILSDLNKGRSPHLLIMQGIPGHLGLPVVQVWADYSEPFVFFSTTFSRGVTFPPLLFIHITDGLHSVPWC